MEHLLAQDLETPMIRAESVGNQSSPSCMGRRRCATEIFKVAQFHSPHDFFPGSRTAGCRLVAGRSAGGDRMDDYQKHLERQLQQQQQQLRLQSGDLNTPRPNFQQPLLQRPQQPPQWPNIVAAPQPPSVSAPPPGPPGFGRGITPNVNMIPQQQPTQQINPPQNFTSSPQPQNHISLNVVQPVTQKSRTSPSPPSPDDAEARIRCYVLMITLEDEKLRIATILEINSHLIKICVSLQLAVPPQNRLNDPTYNG
jgi:hypothetical protein